MGSRPYRDLWARSADGLKLHARAYGDDDAPAVVCLPGLARHAVDFHHLATELTDPDAGPTFSVLAVDYRGRGRSDHDPDPTHYSVPVETADVAAMLKAFGIARAVFIGTSRGGMITMVLAAAEPGLVAGAVLNDIGPVLERPGLLRIKGYVGKLRQPRDMDEAAGMLEGLFGRQFPNLTDRDWRDWAAATWETAGGRLALAYDPALAATLEPLGPESDIPHLWGAFAALQAVPVLLIRGALSDLLSAETADAMRQAHPDLDLVTVSDQGHAPLLRGELLRPIRRFVERAHGADPRA